MDKNNPNSPEDPKNVKPIYEVGYKKPPKHTQFLKGKSGNNKGRPKGARNKPKELPTNLLNELVIEECTREITIHEDGKRKKVSKIEATLKSLSMKGIKGDHRSQKLMLELFGIAEKSKSDLKRLFFEEAAWFKLCALKELKDAKKRNLPVPDIIPHPHHIKIDARAGTAEIIGPLAEDEKEAWDMWVARKLSWLDTIKELKHMLETGRDSFDGSPLNDLTRKSINDDIEHLENLVSTARRSIPDDYYIPPSTMEFLQTKPDIYKF